MLSEPAIGKVTGLVLGGVGGFDLSWNAFPGALCYNVYFIGNDNVAVPLAQCVPEPPFTLPNDLEDGVIVVTQITLEGEGPPSDPIPYPTTPPSGNDTVTVATECPQAARGTFPVNFRISREPGQTTGNLIVNFTLSGTAVNGTDYNTIALSAVIPNGATFVDVLVTPIQAALTVDKTVVLTLDPSLTYIVGAPDSASMLLRHTYFQVANYGGSEPIFEQAAAATPSSFCEWDGTFTFEDTGGAEDVWWVQDSNGTIIIPEVAIDGKEIFFAFVASDGSDWNVSLQGFDSGSFSIETIWEGEKIGGGDPTGVYTRTGGNDLRAQITIE